MIYLIFAIVMVLIITTVSSINELSDFQRELRDLKNEIKFNNLRPEIQEYSDLKGYTDFSLHGSHVQFRIGMFRDFVHLEEVSKGLSELKKVLELNCPKNCAKKKR